MTHRYELEKYKGIRSRYECPACHHKQVFARYIDTRAGGYLSPDVGRCNREDNCGYHYTPKEYFHDHPEKKEYKVSTRVKIVYNKLNTIRNNTKVALRVKQLQPQRIDCIPEIYIPKYLGTRSDFVYFLRGLFNEPETGPIIQRLTGEYCLGCTDTGAVIYWQIDGQKRVRTGKVMRYNPQTGKRLKNGCNAVDWMHARLKREGVLPEEWELSQCLFGEHLLKGRPGDTVCLVESEKSAVIGSGVMPGYVWLATGGKQNLKTEKCECLKGRNVILFPDLGAFDVWKEKGEAIARRVGFTLSVSDTLERISTPEDRRDGLDIADYMIKTIKTKN